MRTKTLLSVALFFGAMTALSPPHHLRAQGENHWYNQFGDHSFLLSGAVIGGVSDLGAVFYNPGRLARIESASFFLHANGFQMTQTSVDGAGPAGGDLVVRDYGTSPSFSAGSGRLPFWPDQTFAYSYLTRRSRDTQLTLGRDSQSDVPDRLPEIDAVSGIVDIDSYVKEDWYGLSWSTSVHSDLSIGLSVFATKVSREHNVALDTRLAAGPSVEALILKRAHNLTAWGVLAKAGVAASRGAFDFGLTFTSPQLHVWGNGATRYEELVVVGEAAPGEDSFVVDRQNDLPARVESPMAVGFGMAWRRGRAVLHLSGEWYSGLARHTVLESDTIRTPFGEQRDPYVVVTELDPVLNAGAGAEWKFNNALAMFASMATDDSAAPESAFIPTPDNEVNTNFLIGDAMHFGAGVSARTRWFSISTGLTYSGSSDRFRRPFPLILADDATRFESLKVSTTTWRLLIAGSILIMGDAN